jgi:hypothetical protein
MQNDRLAVNPQLLPSDQRFCREVRGHCKRFFAGLRSIVLTRHRGAPPGEFRDSNPPIHTR